MKKRLVFELTSDMDCSSALAMLPQPSSNIKYTPLKPLFEFHETISQRFWNAATVYILDDNTFATL